MSVWTKIWFQWLTVMLLLASILLLGAFAGLHLSHGLETGESFHYIQASVFFVASLTAIAGFAVVLLRFSGGVRTDGHR